MSKELSPLEALERLRNTLLAEGYWQDVLQDVAIIETALKKYEELTSKPAILYGRTHKYAQTLIDTICKNYKEVKITNLEDEKKLKALEIIKEKPQTLLLVQTCENYDTYLEIAQDSFLIEDIYSPKEFDLLKEVLL